MVLRKLGFWETKCKFAHDLVYGTGSVMAIVNIQGLIQPSILEAALRQLIFRHPLLRASIQNKSDGAIFYIHEISNPLPLQYDALNPEELVLAIETELNKRFSNEHYLWRIRVISLTSTIHYLFLTAHHAIIDALSLTTFFHELLENYSHIFYKKELKITPLPFLTNIEKKIQSQNTWANYLYHISAFDNQKIDKISFEQFDSLRNRKTKVICVELNENFLALLKNEVHSHHTTVNAALNAMLLLTARDLQNNLFNIALNTPINLRNYCKPILSLEHIGCYISMVKTLHHLSSKTTFWELAQSYAQTLKEHLPHLGLLPQNFEFNAFDSMELTNIFGMHETSKRDYFSDHFGISNIGEIKFNINYDPLQLHSFYFCTNRQVGDFYIFLNVVSIYSKIFFCFAYVEPLLSQASATLFAKTYIDNLHKLLNLPNNQ